MSFKNSEKLVFIDCEIGKTIKQAGGWEAFDKMGLACTVVYDADTDTYKVFDSTVDGLSCLNDAISGKYVVGFNHLNFDYPLIEATIQNHEYYQLITCWADSKTDKIVPYHSKMVTLGNYDILKEIFDTLGHRQKGTGLGTVCEATLGIKKSMDGAHAPILWQEGKITEVISYCIHDVKMTRDLFLFIRKYGYVIIPNFGKLKIKRVME